ncbi:hypothetical protein D3C72_120610 [compost metagenome]
MRHPLVTGLCSALTALTLLLGCAEEEPLIGGRPAAKRPGTMPVETSSPSDEASETPQASSSPTAKPTAKPTPTPTPSVPPPPEPEANPTPDFTPSPEPSADFDLQDPDATSSP